MLSTWRVITHFFVLRNCGIKMGKSREKVGTTFAKTDDIIKTRQRKKERRKDERKKEQKKRSKRKQEKKKGEKMKEKKRNTTTFSCVVVSDKEETLLKRLLEFYNNNTTQKKILAFSDYEKRCLISLLARYGEERVKEGFKKAEQSDFLSGRKGCDWSADLRWIVTPRNFENILNGRYDDYKYGSNRTSKNNEASSALSSFEDDEFIKAALARGFSD